MKKGQLRGWGLDPIPGASLGGTVRSATGSKAPHKSGPEVGNCARRLYSRVPPRVRACKQFPKKHRGPRGIRTLERPNCGSSRTPPLTTTLGPSQGGGVEDVDPGGGRWRVNARDEILVKNLSIKDFGFSPGRNQPLAPPLTSEMTVVAAYLLVRPTRMTSSPPVSRRPRRHPWTVF